MNKQLKQMQEEIDAIKRALDYFVQLQKEEDWLDNADIKMRFHISDSTLYRMRKEGKIPFVKIRGKYHYPKSFLNDYLLGKI
ncbi:helix-turn-helix domain-containing protein [Flavobacterium sp. U410]|jgi:excisionase family DNA binding protein